MKISFNITLNKNKTINFLLQIARNSSKNNIATLKQKESKVFCIGFNKTGTTSLERALINFGFKMGNQVVAEILAEDWASKRTDRILRYCETADGFQDIPFSLPRLYKELDKAFPNSKFILTIRNDENQWYNSLVKFHTKLFSENSNIPPTEKELSSSTYRYKGFVLDHNKDFWKYPEFPLYDEQHYKAEYLEHIADVKKHFINKTKDLLILNITTEKSYQKLATFLNIKVKPNDKFPWLNKT